MIPSITSVASYIYRGNHLTHLDVVTENVVTLEVMPTRGRFSGRISFEILEGFTKANKLSVPNKEETTRWLLKIIAIKWHLRVTQSAAAARARAALAYLTVQIAATLRFGARDKVIARIVISVTSARDLRATFAEVPAAQIPIATDSARLAAPLCCFRLRSLLSTRRPACAPNTKLYGPVQKFS